jgi:hypothetical protein
MKRDGRAVIWALVLAVVLAVLTIAGVKLAMRRPPVDRWLYAWRKAIANGLRVGSLKIINSGREKR